MLKLISLILVIYTYGSVSGDIIEGDIKIQKKSWGEYGQRKNWPNGKVPYVISTTFLSSARSKIISGMNTIEANSCIKFVPKQTTDRNYLNILSDKGCYSFVGVQNTGAQTVSYGNGCLNKNTIMHELFHALGFWHEQSRQDRDRYVNIIWNNIQAGTNTNFKKQGGSEGHETSYDYASLMHYNPFAFSKNSLATIVSKDPTKTIQRNGLSSLDIKALNDKYQCSKNTVESHVLILNINNDLNTSLRVFLWDYTLNKNVYYGNVGIGASSSIELKKARDVAIVNDNERKFTWLYVSEDKDIKSSQINFDLTLN